MEDGDPHIKDGDGDPHIEDRDPYIKDEDGDSDGCGTSKMKMVTAVTHRRCR